MSVRIYATCDIGQEALQRLRDKGWALEVYDRVEPPPQALVVEKVASGIDVLITTCGTGSTRRSSRPGPAQG
jgi:hypothetical protein